MKLLFLIGCLLLVQSSFCDDDVTTKKCEDFLPADTCTKLRNAASTLKEKTSIVADAVKSAIQKHKTNAEEMLKFIKEYMVEKAVNFQCTDVLTVQQCNDLTNLANTFKLKADELQKFLKESIVDGTIKAKEIYEKTIGAFLNHLDHVKCEDMISASACAKLNNLAGNLKETAAEVKLAVATAIANGVTKTQEIVKKAEEFLKDVFSCDKFLKDICEKLRYLARALNVSFQKVIQKLKDLYANNVPKSEVFQKVSAYIWNLFWGSTTKRSLTTQTITDTLMKLIEKVTTIGKDVSAKLKAEIISLFKKGKITLLNVRNFVKELVAKYGTQSDDSYDAGVGKSIIEQLKEALKNAHGKAKELLKKLLTKSKEQLEKMKEVIKTLLGNQADQSDAVNFTYDTVADLVQQELDEELKKASDEVDKMME